MARDARQRKRPGVTREAPSFVRAGRPAVPILRIVFVRHAGILPDQGLFPSMKILKILLCVVVGLVGLTIFGKVRQGLAKKTGVAAAAPAKQDDPGLSAQGFFFISDQEARNKGVKIMTVPNCPSEEAARAEALASAVRSAGVPVQTQQGVGFDFNHPADFERVKKYMENIPQPLVIVSGWAKGNPTAADVIAQYRAAQ